MYVRDLIAALKPFGDVLEIGFGSWTQEIQKYHPKSHTIISMDEQAEDFARKHSAVTAIRGVWQEELERLGVFDTIFFASFVPSLPFALMVYTDAVLDEFCKRAQTNKIALSKFLAELERNEQISKEQKEAMIQKYDLTFEKPPLVTKAGQMLPFLKNCLANHMRKGSRFSCYLKNELDDPEFFNEIIVNPNVDYRENGKIVVIEKLV